MVEVWNALRESARTGRPGDNSAVATPLEEVPGRGLGVGDIESVNCEGVGMASVALGAGRVKKTDSIVHGAGIIIKVTTEITRK